MAGPTTSPASSPSSSQTDGERPSPELEARIAGALAGWPDGPGRLENGTDRMVRLTGDASNRIYVRVYLDQPEGEGSWPATVMAMVMPLEPSGSEEFGAGAAAGSDLPFVTMARWLDQQGVPVPRLEHWSCAERVLLLEDLGDRTLERALLEDGSSERRLTYYRHAVDLLVDWQERTDRPDDPFTWTRPVMDRGVLEWELEHYVEWRLLADLGHEPGDWQASLAAAYQPLLDALVELPTRLIHRDFQSRNLMCVEGPDGSPRYRLIDFQDAMRGPYIYDLVALLRDSYVELEPDELDELVRHYAEVARERGVIDRSVGEVRRDFDLQTVQRKLKDTGRFVFIDRQKGNPSFLPYRAPSMRYVWAALERLDELADLRELLERLDPLDRLDPAT